MLTNKFKSIQKLLIYPNSIQIASTYIKSTKSKSCQLKETPATSAQKKVISPENAPTKDNKEVIEEIEEIDKTETIEVTETKLPNAIIAKELVTSQEIVLLKDKKDKKELTTATITETMHQNATTANNLVTQLKIVPKSKLKRNATDAKNPDTSLEIALKETERIIWNVTNAIKVDTSPNNAKIDKTKLTMKEREDDFFSHIFMQIIYLQIEQTLHLIQISIELLQKLKSFQIMSNSHHIPTTTNFTLIDCEQAFKGLNQKQALYAYNFAKASWNGAKICYFQRSYESPALLYIILRTFQNKNSHEMEQIAIKNKFTQIEVKQLYIYFSAFLNNCGNFKSFGDSKFVPQCSEQCLRNFFLLSEYWSKNVEEFNQIFNRISKFIFTYEKPYELLNFIDKDGTTGYYSRNVSSSDAERVKQITVKRGVMSQNNRLVKLSQNEFVLKVASIDARQQIIQQNGIKLTLKYGQFAPFLNLVNKYLSQAHNHAANDIQKDMIKQYIEHFKTGNMETHKQSQKHWIKDIGPVVETNIGFIQSYLDPLKIRSQFEGFVSVVNKEQSQLLNKLVQSAPVTLQYLTWGKNFEVQEFKKPDFTSLDVLAFASSGVPVGINIPNYHDIRQNYGFKNVNLGNAYGQPSVQSMQFTPVDKIDLCLKYYKPSLFVLVALHQLLGHGSGKLLTSKPEFKSPLDGEQITTFYGPNQTWHSVFGQIASTYQQCKADSVGLYLSLFEDVQEILLPKFSKQQRWDIVYVEWFDLIISGLKGLIYFDVSGNKWLQAHVGASYAILKVLEQEGGIFQIKQTQRDGKPYLQVHMDKQAFKTKGKQAIGKFLQHLQVYKSTGDSKRGQAYFNKYLQVNEQFLGFKKIVEANRRPRRIDVQSDVQLHEGKVKYVRYQSNTYGCIDSGVAHFGQNAEDLIKQWESSNQQFKY